MALISLNRQDYLTDEEVAREFLMCIHGLLVALNLNNCRATELKELINQKRIETGEVDTQSDNNLTIDAQKYFLFKMSQEEQIEFVCQCSDVVQPRTLTLGMPEQVDLVEPLSIFYIACQEVEIRKKLKYCKNPLERLMLERDLSFVKAHTGCHKGSKKKKK